MDALMLYMYVVMIVGCATAYRPCVDYTELGYPFRSVNYTTPASEPKQCDNLNVKVPDLWYRFNQYTGGQMPEFCPDLYSCATQFPIWMDGTHPSIPNVETAATACTNKGTDCCQTSKSMSVMLCHEEGEIFYVYRLPVVDECPSFYCAGDMTPCPFHQIWDYDNGICIDKPAPTTRTTTVPTTLQPVSSQTTGTTTTEQEPKTNDSNTGFILGLSIGCSILGALVAAVFILLFMKRNKTPPAAPKITPNTTPEPPQIQPGYIEKPPPYSK